MADLTGADYRARVELSDRDGAVVAAVGETCARVPASSLGWLLEQGLIEPVAVVTEPERGTHEYVVTFRDAIGVTTVGPVEEEPS